jgi:hypothetical protein
VGDVQVGQAGDQLVGPLGDLLVVGQDAGQRLVRQQPERVGPPRHVGFGHVVVVTQRRRALHGEVRPALLGRRDVLDQPAQGQLAHGGALPGLLVGQVPGGEAQEVSGRGQPGQDVGALAIKVARHGRPLSSFSWL